MSYIVVVRKEGEPLGTHSIFRVRSMVDLARRLKRQYAARPLIGWTDAMDDEIRRDYYAKSASRIAAHLAQITGEPVTKNAVIRRAGVIGVANHAPRNS